MADPSNVDLSSRSKTGKDFSVHEEVYKKQKKISNSTLGSSTSGIEDEAKDPNIEIIVSDTRPIGRKEAKVLEAKLLHRWPTVLRKRT